MEEENKSILFVHRKRLRQIIKGSYKFGLWLIAKGGGFNFCALLMAVFSAPSIVPGTQWAWNIFFWNILKVHCYLNIRILILENSENRPEKWKTSIERQVRKIMITQKKRLESMSTILHEVEEGWERYKRHLESRYCRAGCGGEKKLQGSDMGYWRRVFTEIRITKQEDRKGVPIGRRW